MEPCFRSQGKIHTSSHSCEPACQVEFPSRQDQLLLSEFLKVAIIIDRNCTRRTELFPLKRSSQQNAPTLDTNISKYPKSHSLIFCSLKIWLLERKSKSLPRICVVLFSCQSVAREITETVLIAFTPITFDHIHTAFPLVSVSLSTF